MKIKDYHVSIAVILITLILTVNFNNAFFLKSRPDNTITGEYSNGSGYSFFNNPFYPFPPPIIPNPPSYWAPEDKQKYWDIAQRLREFNERFDRLARELFIAKTTKSKAEEESVCQIIRDLKRFFNDWVLANIQEITFFGFTIYVTHLNNKINAMLAACGNDTWIPDPSRHPMPVHSPRYTPSAPDNFGDPPSPWPPSTNPGDILMPPFSQGDPVYSPYWHEPDGPGHEIPPWFFPLFIDVVTATSLFWGGAAVFRLIRAPVTCVSGTSVNTGSIAIAVRASTSAELNGPLMTQTCGNVLGQTSASRTLGLGAIRMSRLTSGSPVLYGFSPAIPIVFSANELLNTCTSIDPSSINPSVLDDACNPATPSPSPLPGTSPLSGFTGFNPAPNDVPSSPSFDILPYVNPSSAYPCSINLIGSVRLDVFQRLDINGQPNPAGPIVKGMFYVPAPMLGPAKEISNYPEFVSNPQIPGIQDKTDRRRVTFNIASILNQCQGQPAGATFTFNVGLLFEYCGAAYIPITLICDGSGGGTIPDPSNTPPTGLTPNTETPLPGTGGPPATCGSTFPACNGQCPTGQSCKNTGNACECQTPPACGGCCTGPNPNPPPACLAGTCPLNPYGQPQACNPNTCVCASKSGQGGQNIVSQEGSRTRVRINPQYIGYGIGDITGMSIETGLNDKQYLITTQDRLIDTTILNENGGIAEKKFTLTYERIPKLRLLNYKFEDGGVLKQNVDYEYDNLGKLVRIINEVTGSYYSFSNFDNQGRPGNAEQHKFNIIDNQIMESKYYFAYQYQVYGPDPNTITIKAFGGRTPQQLQDNIVKNKILTYYFYNPTLEGTIIPLENINIVKSNSYTKDRKLKESLQEETIGNILYQKKAEYSYGSCGVQSIVYTTSKNNNIIRSETITYVYNNNCLTTEIISSLYGRYIIYYSQIDSGKAVIDRIVYEPAVFLPFYTYNYYRTRPANYCLLGICTL